MKGINIWTFFIVLLVRHTVSGTLSYSQKLSGIKGEMVLLNGNNFIPVTVRTFLVSLTFIMYRYMDSVL